VMGYEHVGDHEGAKAALMAQKAAAEAERRALQSPMPQRPPSTPKDPTVAIPAVGEMEGLSKPFIKEDILGTKTSAEGRPAPKSLSGEFPTTVTEVVNAPKDGKVPTHLMARPDEAPEQTLWTPRGRPTPHRGTKPRTSGRRKPSRALLGLRTLGTVMVLGFAALAGTD
jgi:hypothetical protein